MDFWVLLQIKTLIHLILTKYFANGTKEAFIFLHFEGVKIGLCNTFQKHVWNVFPAILSHLRHTSAENGGRGKTQI